MKPHPLSHELGKLRLTVRANDIMLGPWRLFRDDTDQLRLQLQHELRRGAPRLVVTANVDHIVKLLHDQKFNCAYDRAALRLVDGVPLAWLGRAVSGQKVNRHTGADLLPLVSSWSAQTRERIVMFGGSPGVGRAAANRLMQRFPGANVAHIDTPLIGVDTLTPELNSALRALAPDYVFVCLGAPKQELWFTRNEHELPPAVYIGAGAAIDFAAGAKRRAPKLMQVLSLEWAWRLLQEPRRLSRRYLVEGPKFIQVAFRSVLPRRAG